MADENDIHQRAQQAVASSLRHFHAQPQHTIDHLPRTQHDLETLTVQEKILASAAVASGEDAVAYYRPDGKGNFKLAEKFDLYDFDHRNPTRFDATLAASALRDDTFATPDAVRDNATYQIPVRENGKVMGVVVIHATQAGSSRVQTAEEAAQNAGLPQGAPLKDVHESADVAMAKLQMAADIVQMNKAHLLKEGGRVLPEGTDIGTPKEKEAFMLQMAKDMFRAQPKFSPVPESEYAPVRDAKTAEELRLAIGKILPHDNTNQGLHVKNVADMMKYTMEGLNDGKAKPVVTAEQVGRMEELAMLHDVGKGQLSSAFLQNYASPDPKEQTARDEEAYGRNANHAVFTGVQLDLYPATAAIVKNHHHGHDRYTEPELDKNLHGKKDEYVIAADHASEKEVSVLSRMLRVADVTQRITDDEVGKPLHVALQEMAEKAGAIYGKDDQGKRTAIQSFDLKKMDANTIDADSLAFMIAHGVFHSFGQQREVEERAAGKVDGWRSKGASKYDDSALSAVEKDILEKLHWPERKAEVEARIEAQVTSDPALAEHAVSSQASLPRVQRTTAKITR